jgi:hypothetical protein
MKIDKLISAQAVLDMWRQEICYDRTCSYRDEGRCTETFCDFKLFEYNINHMPPANPQDRKLEIDMTYIEWLKEQVESLKDTQDYFRYGMLKAFEMCLKKYEEKERINET